MYKLNDGLPYYLKVYKQDLALNQDLPQNVEASGNLGPIEVDGINGGLEVIARAHTDVTLDKSKGIKVILQHSDDGTTWDTLGKISFKTEATTLTKPGETIIWQLRLPPVSSKTKLQVTTDIKFGGQIQAWYDNNLGNIINLRGFPDGANTFSGDEEHFVNNANGGIAVLLYVVTHDLSVSGEGKIIMALQREETKEDKSKSWIDWQNKIYTLSSPTKISAGTEFGRLPLSSKVKRFLKANISTDDSHCAGAIDVLLTYLPR